jgi:hypothetical protein
MKDRMFKEIVHKYQYVHLALGLIGNTLFVIGSILFFQRFSAWHHVAVWIFVFGSAGMWIGAVGKAIVEWDRKEKQRQ